MRRFVPLLAAVLGFACSSTSAESGVTNGDASTSTGDASTSTSTSGFDCPMLRDHQASANCRGFDASRYLTDCEATKSSVPASCKPKLDALGSCFLGQPITCTDGGSVNDETPAACKTQEADLFGCK